MPLPAPPACPTCPPGLPWQGPPRAPPPQGCPQGARRGHHGHRHHDRAACTAHELQGGTTKAAPAHRTPTSPPPPTPRPPAHPHRTPGLAAKGQGGKARRAAGRRRPAGRPQFGHMPANGPVCPPAGQHPLSGVAPWVGTPQGFCLQMGTLWPPLRAGAHAGGPQGLPLAPTACVAAGTTGLRPSCPCYLALHIQAGVGGVWGGRGAPPGGGPVAPMHK